MDLFAASGLINGLIAMSFGLLVIFKNWRDRSNQLFFLLTIALSVWSFGYWRWLSSPDYETALFWVRFLSVGSLFVPVFFFHWIVSFTKRGFIDRIIVFLSYIVAIAVSATAGTKYFIEGLEKKSIFTFWPNSGIAYDVFFSYIYVGLTLYSLYVLIEAYCKSTDKNTKGQIMFIIIGALLGFGGGLTNFPLWWGINIPPYGNFLISAFPFLLGYSVIKYRLFNFKTIAIELLVFFITVILVVQTVLSDTLIQFLLRLVLTAVIFILGCLLIRGVYREIGQRELIEKQEKDLEVANAGQVNLIHILNHQIKGFLTIGRNVISEVLSGSYGNVDAPAKKLLAGGFDSLTEGVNFTTQILNASSVVDGTMMYAMAPLDIRVLVENVASEERVGAEKKGLVYKIEIQEGVYTKNGDAAHLREVFKNLINNAILYTPSGGVTVALSCADNKIIFSVKDTGVGIDADDKVKLFTEGGRGKDALKINTESTGYGLSFVKGVVTAHHGTVRAESEGVGKGSTFTVELPVEFKV